MGLDGEELIARLQDDYDIVIAEDYFAQPEATRVGYMFSYVLLRLDAKRSPARAPDSPKPATDEWETSFTEAERNALWASFRWVVADQLGAPPEDVTSEADIYLDLGAE